MTQTQWQPFVFRGRDARFSRGGGRFESAKLSVRCLVVSEAQLLREALSSVLVRHAATRECRPDEITEGFADEWSPDVVIVGPAPMVLLYPQALDVAATFPRAAIAAIVPEADSAAVTLAAHGRLSGLFDLSVTAAELSAAVRRLARGQRVFPATIIVTRHERGALLSDRQREILALVAAGHTNQEIAEDLTISINTVKFHVRSIFSELDVKSRVEAADVWREMTAHALS